MSETGATDEQLYRVCPACQGSGEKNNAFEAEWDSTCLTCEGEGYQIVPAGAVTLSAEDAADAAHGLMHAIGSVDEDDDRRIARTDDEWRAVITTWRALAAKLGGGA